VGLAAATVGVTSNGFRTPGVPNTEVGGGGAPQGRDAPQEGKKVELGVNVNSDVEEKGENGGGAESLAIVWSREKLAWNCRA